MHSTTPGITFRVGMAGWFHLGSVAPDEGRRQGEAARTRLALGTTVVIPDVRAFMRDRTCTGELAAAIDFPPLGRELRSTQGTFNLLAPTANDQCKVIAIDCAFVARATQYYLAARAEVGTQPRDVWTETTTVRVTLHEGADGTAPIVGAGVLELTGDDLAALVSSVRVTDAESLGDTTLTRTGFGRFFLDELWDTYARPPGTLRRRWSAFTRGVRGLVGGGR